MHIGQLRHAHPRRGSMTHGVMKGRSRRPLGSIFLISVAIMVSAVISQTDTTTTCQARAGDHDDGVFERVRRVRIRMMNDAWGVRPSLVVRWCWFDRAMEVVVPTADGEATATTIAQGQVHVTKMRERTPAAAATWYLPCASRFRRIQWNQRVTQGPFDPSS